MTSRVSTASTASTASAWLTLGFALVLVACPDPGGDEGGSDGDEAETEEAGEDEIGENTPPPAPRLLSPEDGAVDVPPQSQLCWEESVDPDGDAVGYRVWVDGVELANGKTGDYGFASTCTGPLDFADDRTFTWWARAFELDRPGDPEAESPDSETWSFTTAWTSGAMPVFEADFEDDPIAGGWTVSGGASSGDWIWGTPAVVYDNDSAVSQPEGCSLGQGCFYTGANPDGLLGEADVDGGAVVLTSPPFDAGEATSLSVGLDRFFYRSDLVPTGVSLELALLVPATPGEAVDPDDPDSYTAHVLEKLDGGPTATPANAWSAVAYAACGVALGPDMRLRITAADLVDPEAVIVEAAIDNVEVLGYVDDDVCAPGPGALCDPDNPAVACGEDLLCCAEGPVFDGVYRCEHPVPAMGDTPPAEPGDPLTGPSGCDAPDLVVLDEDLIVYLQNLFVAPGSCSLYEGCVGGTGWRRVLRFDTKTANLGARDLLLGVPANHPDLYSYSPCHEHHHFDNYASYMLLDPVDDSVVAEGHKQAFCLLDFDSWAWEGMSRQEDGTYTCINQGLSLGWSDTYGASLDCQWIDVTGVEPGEYTLRMEINLPPEGKAHSTLVELRYDNNVLEIPVEVN